MKKNLQMTGVIIILLALLLPQITYGQVDLGDYYKGGLVFSIDKDREEVLICQESDLGSMDWKAAVSTCKRLGNNWRLPTKEELELMYENLHAYGEGDFEDEYYWSSSDEGDRSDVWDLDFGTGEPNFGGKSGYDENVRAVKSVTLKSKRGKKKRRKTRKVQEDLEDDEDDISGEKGTFTDIRDGQSYRWIKMDDGKIWMAENLNYKTKNSYCYDVNDNYCGKFGRLYTWNAAEFACPEGWSLPLEAEWLKMIKFYGISGKRLAHLLKSGDSGFDLLLSGGRTREETYNDKGLEFYQWTSTEDGSYYARFLKNNVGYNSIGFSSISKEQVAMSCRCLKD